MPLLRSLGEDWGAGATNMSLLPDLGEGRMVVVPEPRPSLTLVFRRRYAIPGPKAPEGWRSPGR
jgi:hypothetical protein